MKVQADVMEKSMDLATLKKENIRSQKRGLPFMMASVVLWALVTGIQMTTLTTAEKNMGAFCCSALMMPVACLFAKLLKAEIFANKDNPINKLGFLCTMNQMLYILIVMWACSECPDRMIMLYAMIFGAHLLPFGWLYETKAYIVLSIAETVLALVVGLMFGSIAVGILMVVSGVILSICLLAKNKRTE
jgi:hypothetical protein